MLRERGIVIPVIRGKIVQGVPMIKARVTRDGVLHLGDGPLAICVDTGFMGDVALPRKMLVKIRRSYAGPIQYRLATGRIESIDQWVGKVRIGSRSYERIFLEGDPLLGMDLLLEVARSLRIDLVHGTFSISLKGD